MVVKKKPAKKSAAKTRKAPTYTKATIARRKAAGLNTTFTVYDEKYCDQIKTHMAKGLSMQASAAKMGMSKRNFDRWRKKYPEFESALQEGLHLCRAFWEDQGIKGLRAKGFNATVWIFNMKNRFGWRDKMEHSGSEDSPLTVKLVQFSGKENK